MEQGKSISEMNRAGPGVTEKSLSRNIFDYEKEGKYFSEGMEMDCSYCLGVVGFAIYIYLGKSS